MLNNLKGSGQAFNFIPKHFKTLPIRQTFRLRFPLLILQWILFFRDFQQVNRSTEF